MALKFSIINILFLYTVFFSDALAQSCDASYITEPSQAPGVLIGIEDDLSINSDFDLNDVEACGTYYLDFKKEVFRGDLRARASGASYLNALYLINPCDGFAKIQVALQEATCSQNDEIHNSVPAGGLVKLSSSFSLHSWRHRAHN